MNTQGVDRFLGRLRTVLAAQVTDDLSDRVLLARFARQRDEAAFAALVRRHGPLVLGVCRRVLGCAHDAEDALQAVFLVLARRAGSVRWEDSARGWIYRCAYRIARTARMRNLRKRMRERPLSQEAGPPMPVEESWSDALRIMDEELIRLPEAYRLPILLCYLEGKTRDEAAAELRWSVGSVKGRLERGRQLLRHRLLRRGLQLPAVMLGGSLAVSHAQAIPPLLQVATVRLGLAVAADKGALALAPASVAALVNAGLRSLWLSSMRWVGAVLLLGLASAGGTLAVHRSMQAPIPPATEDSLSIESTPSIHPPVVDATVEKPALTQSEEKAPEIVAYLKIIDWSMRTVKVRVADGTGVRTLALSKKVSARCAQGPMKLHELLPGTQVTLRLQQDGQTVSEIVAASPRPSRQRHSHNRTGAWPAA